MELKRLSNMNMNKTRDEGITPYALTVALLNSEVTTHYEREIIVLNRLRTLKTERKRLSISPCI